MIKRVVFILKYWLGWIIFFDVARLVFILSNTHELKQDTWNEVLWALWYGLLMDVSMAAYITLPVILFTIVSVFGLIFQKSVCFKIYTATIVFIVLIILFADIGLYKAWGFRLDDTFMRYLSTPIEVWASVSHLPVTLIILSFIIIFSGLIFLSNKFLSRINFQPILKKKLIVLLVLFLVGAAFIIPIRGGFQLAPLNQSSVYFSQNNFANMAALNAPWNFVHALTHHANNKENPFLVEGSDNVSSSIDSLFISNGKTLQLIDIKEHPGPNVLIIVWESLTGKAINYVVDGKEILPGMNQLIKEGIYFSNIYATGDRTDKGIVAVLSGYPAQPTTSIVKEPGKASKLATLGEIFAEKGYNNSFYYGGELEFANMKAYLLQANFKHFISINDFDKKDQNSKWGAHDGVVMKRLQADLQNESQPFFVTWLTLSSHEPYEIPVDKILTGKNDTQKYLSSLHYTDSIVFSFIRNAQLQSWWKNTLIVVVADHGHRLPVNNDRSSDFKIPLLFLGGVLDSSARTIDKVGGQTGLPATLAHQLGWDTEKFYLSRDLLDSTSKPWAMFSFNNGFGFMQPGKKIVYDNVGKRIIQQAGEIGAGDIYQGRLLQQFYFQDYLDK